MSMKKKIQQYAFDSPSSLTAVSRTLSPSEQHDQVDQQPEADNHMVFDDDYLTNFASELSASCKDLRVAHLNIRSLRNKVDELRVLQNVCKLTF